MRRAVEVGVGVGGLVEEESVIVEERTGGGGDAMMTTSAHTNEIAGIDV